MNGLEIGVHDTVFDVSRLAPSSSSSNAWSSRAWNLISARPEMAAADDLPLFLGFGPVRGACELPLGSVPASSANTFSVHQEHGCAYYKRTLSERHVMPLCFTTFFMTVGLPPKNFISFSSQITYSSSVPT